MPYYIDGIIGLLDHLADSNVTVIKESKFKELVSGWVSENLEKFWKEKLKEKLKNKTMKKMDDVFKKMDTDEDGALSKDELIGAFFGIIDKDGNGAVSPKELGKLIKLYAKHMNIKLKKGWWK